MSKPTKLAAPKDTTVQIMGHTWRVKYEEFCPEDPERFGQTDIMCRVITVFTRPHADYPVRGALAATLWHETLHAALHSSGTGNLLKGGRRRGPCNCAGARALAPDRERYVLLGGMSFLSTRLSVSTAARKSRSSGP